MYSTLTFLNFIINVAITFLCILVGKPESYTKYSAPKWSRNPYMRTPRHLEKSTKRPKIV